MSTYQPQPLTLGLPSVAQPVVLSHLTMITVPADAARTGVSRAAIRSTPACSRPSAPRGPNPEPTSKRPFGNGSAHPPTTTTGAAAYFGSVARTLTGYSCACPAAGTPPAPLTQPRPQL